ncbi:hypothetical protein L6452_08725 [Arctium lappa]|uniref:Uncharacterized protein n=1 Tax=Arctium lappa TaxID=4217 RepID=A0ACB9DIX2_ARCLA|nr:hypothetical protein L6452_08725 [Arctium lappa]
MMNEGEEEFSSSNDDGFSDGDDVEVTNTLSTNTSSMPAIKVKELKAERLSKNNASPTGSPMVKSSAGSTALDPRIESILVKLLGTSSSGRYVLWCCDRPLPINR